MPLPRPGFGGGQASLGRLGRGLRRRSGQFAGVKFHFVPEWERNTVRAVQDAPSGDQMAEKVHKGMAEGMRQHSRRAPGGGFDRTDEGWRAGIGSPPSTHTHWHLIEFGGGHHFAQGGVRRALAGMGKFKAKGRG